MIATTLKKIAIYGRLFGDQHTKDVQLLFDELEKRKIKVRQKRNVKKVEI